MKKTCFGCKALESLGSGRYFCGLGYENEVTYNPKQGTVKDIKPLEECPKPKSTKAFFNEMQLKRQTN